jgi:hypothetical protein
MGGVVGRGDLEGVWATEPKGCEVKPFCIQVETTLGLLKSERPGVGHLYVAGDLKCKVEFLMLGA